MRQHSKAAVVLFALVMAVFSLTGCTRHEADISTLYNNNALKIERQGAETRIYDHEGDTVYTFTSHRVKKGTVEPIQAAQTTADTGTVTIQTVHGLIIVTDKATGSTLYVKGAR